MKRYFIIGSVLDDNIELTEGEFEGEEELHQYLEDFDTYDLIFCLNETQLKSLKEQIKELD